MARKVVAGVRTPRTSIKKMTFTRQIYAHVTSADTIVDAAATITIPTDCFLIGITHSIIHSASATGENATSEISTSGNYQGDVNDQPDSLHVIRSQSIAAANVQALNDSISGLRIPFAAGERIYLNVEHVASRVIRCGGVLHFEQR